MSNMMRIIFVSVLMRHLTRQLKLEHITHSYEGSTVGTFRYVFYALFQDYIQTESQWVNEELNPLLSRLARNLKNFGALKRPFPEDTEMAKNEVLKKNWTEEQKARLWRTPGLLVIDTDFDDFDPQVHRWLHLHFGEKRELEERRKYEETIEKLVTVAQDPNRDLFAEFGSTVDADPAIQEGKSGLVEVYSVNPRSQSEPKGYGLSTDFAHGMELIRKVVFRTA